MSEKALVISSKDTVDVDIVGGRDSMATVDGEISCVVEFVDGHTRKIIGG